jgi:hypothetical protein
MKHLICVIGIAAAVVAAPILHAQDTEPATEAAEGLDLYGVAELLKESESIEDFEKRLNQESNEVNNLDLNGDDQVDYITVYEEAEGDTHVAILRVPLGENEYQDVASVDLEKVSGDEIAVQIVGDDELYGPDYIIEPAEKSASAWPIFEHTADRVAAFLRSISPSQVAASLGPTSALMTSGVVVTIRISAWPLLRVVFRPGYRVWRSPYRWGVWPRWWSPWRPVARSTYRARRARWSTGRWNRTKVRHSSRASNIYQTQRKTTKLSKHTPRTGGPGPAPKAAAPGPKTAAPAPAKKPVTTQQKKAPPPKKPTPKKRAPIPK